MDWSCRWQRSERVLYREALDDVVILVPGTDAEPFALAGGASLWRFLAQPRSTGELLASLTTETADPAREAEELEGLLNRLADAGAVHRTAA